MATTAVIIPADNPIETLPITPAVADAIAEQIADDVSDEIEDDLEWLRNSLGNLERTNSELAEKLESISQIVYPLTEHNKALMEMVSKLVASLVVENISTPIPEPIPEPIVVIAPDASVVDQPVAESLPAPSVRKRHAL